jgi:hypothetical protein
MRGHGYGDSSDDDMHHGMRGYDRRDRGPRVDPEEQRRRNIEEFCRTAKPKK